MVELYRKDYLVGEKEKKVTIKGGVKSIWRNSQRSLLSLKNLMEAPTLAICGQRYRDWDTSQ